MGEIGLDFALDHNLRIWFLEANTMPEKDPEPCDDPSGVPTQYLLPMEYARYLVQRIKNGSRPWPAAYCRL